MIPVWLCMLSAVVLLAALLAAWWLWSTLVRPAVVFLFYLSRMNRMPDGESHLWLMNRMLDNEGCRRMTQDGLYDAKPSEAERPPRH